MLGYVGMVFWGAIFSNSEEQRANSVEFNGHYYAALDFTPPNQGGESAGQKTRIQMPYGWEVADITDDVRDAVVRLHTFGTDFVVGESGKAFHTAKGTRPGALEMIWDYKILGCGSLDVFGWFVRNDGLVNGMALKFLKYHQHNYSIDYTNILIYHSIYIYIYLYIYIYNCI